MYYLKVSMRALKKNILTFIRKVEIFLEQREVAFLSPIKIWENLNFSGWTVEIIQIFGNFAGW